MRDRLLYGLAIAITAGLCLYFWSKQHECSSQGMEVIRTPLTGWACAKVVR